MDSHNDVLAMSSQYGIVPGILLCLTIYNLFFNLPRIVKEKGTKNNLQYLFIVNIVMIFAGNTNAGLFKHQVFGFLVLILMIFVLEKEDMNPNNINK